MWIGLKYFGVNEPSVAKRLKLCHMSFILYMFVMIKTSDTQFLGIQVIIVSLLLTRFAAGSLARFPFQLVTIVYMLFNVAVERHGITGHGLFWYLLDYTNIG